MDILGGLTPNANLVKLYYKGINAKVTGPVSLGTIPAGKVFIPTSGYVAIRAAVGVTQAPTIALGTNAPNYNDLTAPAPLTGLSQGNVAPVAFRAQYPYLTPGKEAFINISVAGLASGAYTFDLLMLGVWI